MSSMAAAISDAPQQVSARMLAGFMRAWSASDPGALAELFSDDADLVTPDGTVARGRQEIMAFYTAAFAHGYHGSTGAGHLEHVRQIAPGLVLVDARWSIDGAHKPDGSPRAKEQGILVSLVGLQDGIWRVLAMRESASATALSPLSAAGR
jgi:uncharacterized protein (TIGR02246 family)